MHNRPRMLFVAGVASGLLLSQATFGQNVIPLQPQTATVSTSFRGTHFRVETATSSDLDGESAGDIPAKTISVLDGVGGWDGPFKLRPPRPVLDAPTNIRNKIALFQVERQDWGGGWFAIPRGWRIAKAGAGAQGSWNTLFVAPNGASHGWLVITASGPGAIEVLGSAQGYFPGAYKLVLETFPHVAATYGGTTLSPKPTSLTHPNPCTALVTYPSSGLSVKQVTQRGDDGITTYSVALPANEAALQNFLFASFRETHPARDCPGPIKDWRSSW